MAFRIVLSRRIGGLASWCVFVLVLIVSPFCLAEPLQVNFNVVENQAWHLSEDATQHLAESYLNGLLPKGTSIKSTMAALSKAGAYCDYQVDSRNPTYYVCDYTRRAHGIAALFIELDWMISLHFSSDGSRIEYITVQRYETGL